MAEEDISLQETEDLEVTDKEQAPEVIIEGEEDIVEEAPQEDFYKNLAEDMDERQLQDLIKRILNIFQKVTLIYT